jgi:hypothetical protein
MCVGLRIQYKPNLRDPAIKRIANVDLWQSMPSPFHNIHFHANQLSKSNGIGMAGRRQVITKH